jgi:hypothetical protein
MIMTRIFAGLFLALALALVQTAAASEWQYCLAPAHADHKVYLSAPFPAASALNSADSAFERTLNQAGYRHDDVQCPRADDEHSIAVMRQYAISFNQELGNAIVHLPLEKSR